MIVTPKSAYALGIIALAISLTGCLDHDTFDGSVTPQVQTLATFEGNSPDGARFSYIAQGDGPIINLQASVSVDTVRLHNGDRVLLTYLPKENEGKISLISVVRVNGGTLYKEDAEALKGWDADPLFVEAVWRTGTYINLRCKLLWAPESRRYRLEVDSTTIGCKVPDLYVAHAIPDSTDRTTAYMATNYASFDMQQLWDEPGVRGVKIHVNNSNLPDKNEFIFLK